VEELRDGRQGTNNNSSTSSSPDNIIFVKTEHAVKLNTPICYSHRGTYNMRIGMAKIIMRTEEKKNKNNKS